MASHSEATPDLVFGQNGRCALGSQKGCESNAYAGEEPPSFALIPAKIKMTLIRMSESVGVGRVGP
jgi:hypothetical protein